MGLFQRKTQPADEPPKDTAEATQEHFFDEYFREELRNHGRWYFEKVINENAALFKQDLDTIVGEVHAELKERITKQLDEQLSEFKVTMQHAQDTATESLNKSAAILEERQQELSGTLRQKINDQEQTLLTVIRDAQEVATKSLNTSAHAVEQQQEQLNATMQKNVGDMETMLIAELEESRARIAAMKDAQEVAVQALQSNAKMLQEQQQQLVIALQRNVANQEAILVKTFESDMAQIIEHYLLDAVSEQYDLKAQLPSIIKQMEANKQAIVDDMKL